MSGFVAVHKVLLHQLISRKLLVCKYVVQRQGKLMQDRSACGGKLECVENVGVVLLFE